jgi:hypothetical protein
MKELEEISPESVTPRPRNLEDSQEILLEPVNNLSSSKDEDLEPYIITKSNRKKGNINFFSSFANKFIEVLSEEKMKNKILMIFALVINIVTLFLKLYMLCIMLFYLIKRIKILNTFIFTRILDYETNSYILVIINYIFLFFGFIILFIEMFFQFIIRNKTFLKINECSLKPLILSKIFYFISLGLVPEVIFATVPFRSKKNVFLSFFKIKIMTQPYIIIILILYTLYTLCKRSEDTKKEKILKEIESIKNIVNEFVDNNLFVWNNFKENIILEKEKEKEKNNKEKKVKEKDDNINNIINEPKNKSLNLMKENSFPTIKRRKRKGSNDEKDNNKSKYQKLLGKIDEEENEEGGEKKVLGFVRKFNQFKNRISLFWTDNIFVRIKKYGILSIIGFFLFSPIINGIFGYGYYVFYESDIYRCFQIELILCFVFGFILILLTEE